MIIEGKLSRADVPNLNGHVYSKEILERAVAELQEKIEGRRFFGRVGTQQPEKLLLSDASHLVTGLALEDGRLMAEIEVLDTEKGKLLQQLLDSKEEVTLHPTWVASLNHDGKTVGEDARLIRLDICPYREAAKI